jgi:hypothetical protein
MAKHTKRRNLLNAVALCGAIGACSVINSYDDVVPLNSGSGSAGVAGATIQNQAGTADTLGGAGNGTGATTSMGGVAGSMGGEGGSAEPGVPSTGLVVLGGKLTEGAGDVLVVLDPTDGTELSREAIPGAAVVGLAYDGAVGRDLWFVFTSSDFPADPMSKADLQVRTYDNVSGKWTTRKKVSALPPPRPGSFVVLNDRLAYLSFGLVNGALTDTLTILDTSTPASTKQITFDIAAPGRVLGLVGSRGAPGDTAALGGTLALATGSACTGLGATLKCSSLSLTPIFVGDDITPGVAQSLRGFTGRPAFASAANAQLAFVALPAVTATGNIDVIRFDPRDLMFGAPLSPPTPAKHLAALTVVDCLDLTVFSSVADKALWATSAQGTSAKAVQVHEAQDAVYEPFTSSIIAPYNPDSPLFPSATGTGGAGGAGPEPEVTAFSVSKAGVTPSIKQRADWHGPTDVAVNVAAVRFPIPFTCP